MDRRQRQSIEEWAPRFALAMLCAITHANAIAAAPENPNLIVIFADDLGYGDLGCYGAERITTPVIDRMAKEGMRFTNFYVTSPICTPARASLMTGCYPSRVGLGTPLHTPDKVGLNPDEITVAELLDERGYATACIGKWHLGHHPPFYPTRHGFDHYFGTPLGHCFMTKRMRDRGKFSDLFLNDERKIPFPPVDQLTEILTAEAVRWIEAHAGEPFFLYLAHAMPHGPAAASERFRGRSAGGVYGDAVETIDWSTGEILGALERLKLTRKTLVLFASDNGADPTADWGAAGDWFGSNAPLRGKKQQAWEGGLRVPCIARWPGRVPAGTVCEEVTTVMDILPTFARLAGATPPDDRVIDGHDIRPLLFGEPGASSPYDAFIYHVRFGRIAGVRSGDWKLLLDVDARTWRHRGTSLYNLRRDLSEQRNVANAHPDVVERLTNRLERFRLELNKTSRPAGSLP